MQSIPTNLKDECCSPPNLHLRSVSALSGLPPTPGSRQPAEPRSAEDLLPIVYEELRRIAAHKLARQTPGVTLQPTALVHEAWLRMTRNDPTGFAGRAHFFAAAAEAMRHILIDAARRKLAKRHGGGLQRVDIDEFEMPALVEDEELLAVHEAMDRLAAENPKQAQLAKLRYFVGLSFAEAAEILEISVPTAKRHWAFARAWLYTDIKGNRAD